MGLFKFKIDDEIKHIYFFKKNDKFLKKMYIYVTKNDKLIIKGLPMIKSDSSKLGYKVFKKYMQKKLKKGKKNFKYKEIKRWAEKELKKDISIMRRSFKVKKHDWYKNESQLQAQISKKYGAGKHLLITNNKYGVGKSKKYCTLKEFKEQDLKVDDIDLSKMWSELGYFTNIPKRTRSVRTKRDKRLRIKREQKNLFKWSGV